MIWNVVAFKRATVRRHEVVVHGILFGVEHDERDDPLGPNYDLIWDLVAFERATVRRHKSHRALHPIWC